MPLASPDAPVRLFRHLTAVVLVGLAAGVGGTLLALLLHEIQHLAFGYSEGSFLFGSSQAAPWRRFLAVLAAGVIAGFGWWALYRWGKPLVGVVAAVGDGKKPAKKMPWLSTSTHALLQIITVALGSPLGREVAPREVGALFSGGIARRFGLDAKQTRILIACGAGAGLAAVYNVPLGGAVFALEVLLASFSASAAVVALATSAIASAVSWLAFSNSWQYQVGPLTFSPTLIIWAAIIGPIIGLLARGFSKFTSLASKYSPRNWRIIPSAILAFSIIGAISIAAPEVLGNGKSVAQMTFDQTPAFWLLLLLLVLRQVVVGVALIGGGQGGLLTPSLANGALIGMIAGAVWSNWFGGSSLAAFALIGAAAFLAAAQKMPLTAIVLVLELTRMDQSILMPLVLAVAGSVASYRFRRRAPQPSATPAT